VNNVLTLLSTLLKKAVEWGELERLPCTIKLLPVGFQKEWTPGFQNLAPRSSRSSAAP